MSYSVAICRSEFPSDDKAAWLEANALADALRAGEVPSAEFKDLHDELTARYPCLCSLPDDEIDDGVWSDGPLINNFGQRIAVLSMAFSAVDEVLPFLVATANSHGMTVFDGQTDTIHRPGDLVLTVEGEPELRNPAVSQVEAAIKRLTPRGGPGFAILGAVRDYVQTAGGDGLYCAEWRQHQGDGFRHWAAGKSGDASAEISIPTNGFEVAVKANECLNTQDVLTIFAAFLAGKDRPAAFEWRDITERFV